MAGFAPTEKMTFANMMIFSVGFLAGVIVLALTVYLLARSQDERIAKHHRGEP